MSCNGAPKHLMEGAGQDTAERQGVVSAQISKLFNVHHFSLLHCSEQVQAPRELFAKSYVLIWICFSNSSFKLKLMVPKEYKCPNLFLLPLSDHYSPYTECFAILLSLAGPVNISPFMRSKVQGCSTTKLSPKLVINKWCTVQLDVYSVWEWLHYLTIHKLSISNTLAFPFTMAVLLLQFHAISCN